MPQNIEMLKTVLLSSEITSRIRDILFQIASCDRFCVSKWLRNHIILKLINTMVISSVLRLPKYNFDMDDYYE